MPPVAPAPLPAPPKADDIDDAKAFPLLSGYLYKLGRNNKWQWRLFRFDGTLFTCLSPTVIKIENPGSTFTLSSSLYVPTSTPMPFITSPLLTGVSNPSECGNVLHVQLPKWTIHMADVEQIGLVRKPKKSKKDGKEEDTRAAPVNGAAGKPTEPVFNFNGARNCFLIRTHDGRNHIMRAKRNEDLERWLFVLVRMWKVAVDAKLKGPSPSIDSIPPADPFDRYKRDIPFVPPPQEASPEGASELPKDPPPYPSATAQSTSTGKEIPRKAPPTADESPRGAVIVRRPSAENLDEEDGNWVDDATLERSGVRIVPIIMPVQAETGKATGTAGGGMLSPPTSPTRMYGSSLPLSPTTPKSKNVRFMQVLNDMGEDDVQIEQPRAVKRLQTASLTPGVGPLGLEEAAAKADANSTNPFAGAARHGRAPSNPLLYYPARTASLLHAPEQLHEIPTFAPPPSFVRGVVKGILKRPTVDVGTGASSGSFGLVPPERKGSIGVVDGVSTLAGLGGGGMLHRRSMTAPVAIEYSIDMGQNYVAPTPVVPTSLVNTQSPLAAISEREEEESDGIGHLAELATPPPTTKLRSRGSKDKESRKRDSTLRRNKESAPVIQWHEGETVSGNGDAPGIGFDGGETVAAWRDTLGRVARRHSGYQQL
ncbi:hypothetical protein HK097_004008 [Rhizophlyctis rosea]|uniref:PH domain-containing protein n=1 Tax=Rhizophlyctis rosea TaxID=64517 RepID=A0AAD5X6Q8_9FUNG|nr:hypothetical protein HK097_004008 [Rhizophlyctis rosea]